MNLLYLAASIREGYESRLAKPNQKTYADFRAEREQTKAVETQSALTRHDPQKLTQLLNNRENFANRFWTKYMETGFSHTGLTDFLFDIMNPASAEVLRVLGVLRENRSYTYARAQEDMINDQAALGKFIEDFEQDKGVARTYTKEYVKVTLNHPAFAGLRDLFALYEHALKFNDNDSVALLWALYLSNIPVTEAVGNKDDGSCADSLDRAFHTLPLRCFPSEKLPPIRLFPEVKGYKSFYTPSAYVPCSQTSEEIVTQYLQRLIPVEKFGRAKDTLESEFLIAIHEHTLAQVYRQHPSPAENKIMIDHTEDKSRKDIVVALSDWLDPIDRSKVREGDILVRIEHKTGECNSFIVLGKNEKCGVIGLGKCGAPVWNYNICYYLNPTENSEDFRWRALRLNNDNIAAEETKPKTEPRSIQKRVVPQTLTPISKAIQNSTKPITKGDLVEKGHVYYKVTEIKGGTVTATVAGSSSNSIQFNINDEYKVL